MQVVADDLEFLVDDGRTVGAGRREQFVPGFLRAGDVDRDQFDEVFRIFGACIAADQPDLECRGVRLVGIPAGIAHIERSGDLLEVGGIGLGLVEDVPELVVDRLEVVRAGIDRGYLQGIHIEERDLLASFRRAEDDRAVAFVGRRTGEEDDLREVSTDEVPAARHFVIGLKAECDDQLGQRDRLVVIGGRQVVTHARLDVRVAVLEFDVVGREVMPVEPTVEIVLHDLRRLDHARGPQVVFRAGCEYRGEEKQYEEIYEVLFHNRKSFLSFLSGVGRQSGGDDVGRQLQAAARVAVAAFVGHRVGHLDQSILVLVDQAAVKGDSVAAGVEPAHAQVHEFDATHEENRMDHVLLRAGVDNEARVEFFLGRTIHVLQVVLGFFGILGRHVVAQGICPFVDRLFGQFFVVRGGELVLRPHVHVGQGGRIVLFHDIGLGTVEQRFVAAGHHEQRVGEADGLHGVGVFEEVRHPRKQVAP